MRRALGEEVVDRVLSHLRLPRLAHSHERPLPDQHSFDGFSEASLKESIRHEWVRTLSDLVERRLLLIFDPRLDQPRLQQLEMLLAAEGVISPDRINSEIATAITRLRQVLVSK